ncbi:unnamed protein product [Alopecurus aequalis]
MASHGRDHDHDALWAKLWELELQLAAYKLLHAARRGEEEEDAGTREPAGTGSCCRGRQYDAYMRRRDARRVSAAAAEPQAKGQQLTRLSVGTRVGCGRPTPLTVMCAARDTPQVRRTLRVVPTTPRKEHGALPMARSRTVSSGAPAARSQSHQRRNSVGGDCATPRPFLRRGSGTGGATAVYLRSPRVHDLPSSSPSPRRPPRDQLTTKPAVGRHLRSVSELPFAATATMESPKWAETPARARKRWGSLESAPPAIFTAAATNPHMDLAKGLRKLLSFVRKSKGGERQHGCGGGGRDSGAGKPVKGWAEATARSGLDGPFDRASLQGHRFPMTRAVGTSG